MAKVKQQISKAREIEWTSRRVAVVIIAGAAFCLPFVGILTMTAVVKFGWK